MYLAYNWWFLLSNRNREALSASTSFCAWFMIWTMRVSMLIISWKMDLKHPMFRNYANEEGLD